MVNSDIMKTMKYIFPALMLLAGVACNKEIVAPEQDNVQEEATETLELSASIENSRTSLASDGESTRWTSGDEIAVRKVFNDNSTKSRWYKFTVKTLSEDPSKATFTGIIAVGDNYKLEAVYPYNAAFASSDEIKVSIPAVQEARNASYAEKAAVAVGYSQESNINALTFSNIASAMQFKLVHDASSVVISSSDASLAGVFSYSADGNLKSVSDASSSVKLIGDMEAGKTYYAIVAPGTYNISATISGVKVKESSAAIAFNQNVINNLGIIADVNQIPNCYIVKPGATVKIPVYKAFAMWEKAEWTNYKPSEENPGATAVQVLWEDVQGLLTNIIDVDQLPLTDESKLQEKWFTVTTAERKSGNAAVSIRFGGDHRWIVHIWVTDYDGSSYQASNGLEFMDRNLGATSTEVTDPNSFGCYYQACRPTPFPGPVADGTGYKMKSLYVNGKLQENVISSKSNPSTTEAGNCRWAFKFPKDFLFHGDPQPQTQPLSWLARESIISSTDYALNFWPSKTNRKKTAYDPCPAGWMLPVYDESGNSPYSFWDSASDVLKNYPAAGRLKYDFTYAEIGNSAVLWCGDPTGLKTCSAYVNFDENHNVAVKKDEKGIVTDKGYNYNGNHGRANALPVRCVKIK